MINNLNQFAPNAFVAVEETHLLLGDKLLRMRMLENGEFSVEQVIRALDDEAVRTLYDNYSDFEVDYGRDALERWAAAFENNAGKTLFEAYDRQRGGYVGLFERAYGGKERAATVSRREPGRNGQRDLSQGSGTEPEVQAAREVTNQSR